MSPTQLPPSIVQIRTQVSRMLDSLAQDSPISATVVFQVRKEKEAVFKQKADALARDTSKLPGMSVFAYHKHQPYGPTSDVAVQYLIYENWDEVRQFRVQWNSDHIIRFQASVLDLVTAPPDLDFYHGWRERGKLAQVLQTGQRNCWDAEGNPLACDDTGQDGAVQAGVRSPKPRFLDNGNGTVTDLRSGLIWLKDANYFGEQPWARCIESANNLAHGEAGLVDGSQPGDWRLANVNEMQSLVDLSSTTGAALPERNPFINLSAANYWSSTTVALAPALGWFCALQVAPPVFDLKFNPMRMWPVRGGLGSDARIAQTGQTQCYDYETFQPVEGTLPGQDGAIRAGVPHPDPRFSDNGDGTVTDRLTGLIWLKNANRFGVNSWEDALHACNTLSSGECGLHDGSRVGDWRLPNLHEQRSLMNYSRFDPAITEGHPFENLRTSLYWSSTSVPSEPNQCRFVFVGIGPSVWDHKSVKMGVWPVRGGIT